MSISGLVTNIKRFAVHDGEGIRTTVFLKGCPLSCLWCHNPESISARPQLAYYAKKCKLCGECERVCPIEAHKIADDFHTFSRGNCLACGKCAENCRFDALQLEGRRMSVNNIMQSVLEDIDYYNTSGGGLTISGGEPTMQPEFTLALLKTAKSVRINTALDTCGYTSRDIFEEMLPYVDTFLYDIKHISPSEHTRLTGRSNERIVENLRFLSASGAQIEIRIPIIPGCNDDESTLRSMAELLSEVNVAKVKLLPYHSYAGSKYNALGLPIRLDDTLRPSAEHMEWCKKIFCIYGIGAII